MIDSNKVAVISTGNGGQSMAAYFAHKGASVSLYAREQERVDMFHTHKFLLSGVVDAIVRISLISSNMKEVIQNAHLIMITTPSQYHSIVAREMAPYLEDGQIIVLNPGRTFGTFELDSTLKKYGCTADVTLAEAETFILTCRCLEIGCPIIYGIKQNMMVAAHNKERTALVVDCLSKYFSSIKGAQSVLETDFCNIGMIFHPIPILMNITRVEQKEEILYYHSAITPLVASILERMDAERVAVAAAAGVQTPSAMQWLIERYGASGKNLYECIQNTEAYNGVYMPTELNIRYIFEDIPTGCVPIHCAGNALGVPTPIIDAVIQWAGTVYQTDFLKIGRNEESFAIKDLVHRIQS